MWRDFIAARILKKCKVLHGSDLLRFLESGTFEDSKIKKYAGVFFIFKKFYRFIISEFFHPPFLEEWIFHDFLVLSILWVGESSDLIIDSVLAIFYSRQLFYDTQLNYTALQDN